MSVSAALYTLIRQHKRQYTPAALEENKMQVWIAVAEILTIEPDCTLLYCGRQKHSTTQWRLPPALHCTTLQGPGPVTLSFECHCHPASASPLSDQHWPSKGAGVHGWKESGGDIAEGQLGTLWTIAQNHSDKRRKKRRRRE